ncbi:hypothetical protein I3760_09G045100 [Carya illinoinensis]|uniref:Glutaredoxin domain-containing protein n=1 Tax=Carya illinoinensis TaxID=32201 RepID=A0A8T1P8S4_CARIL|nr:uncharacterized protein At5g39865 [Carya illinoinensis]KAG2687300.1 hypothetical protein I3760_09G045100 [Carya illinoinensis]KAG6641036.1 hypothetical protein CIPAW_09G045500 [Carya illinoinensis]KAG6694377.1 hypothetical protein I3842_09G045500 [Carya illinoinensis]
MGCSSSKPNTLLPEHPFHPSSSSSSIASHSSISSPRVPRALYRPTPSVHHPPLRKGDTHHLVSLTSTTYGSLVLTDRPKPPHNPNLNGHGLPDRRPTTQISSITPTPTPEQEPDPEHSLSPDSVINTWELMNGLDDFDSDTEKPIASIFDRPIVTPNKPSSRRYSDCDGSVKKRFDLFESVKNSKISSGNQSHSTKPLWQHLYEEALLAKMDPNVVSSYRLALSSRQLNPTQSKEVRSLGCSPTSYSFSNGWYRLQGCEDRIVIYFTSLRGIRKTYEDCCSVRMIFRGFRVPVDERDISMDSEYRKELQRALSGKAVSLPQVFIRGKYVGGAEEVKQLNEVGELAKLLEGFPIRDPAFVCKGCGDARFVPCPNCNGSRKVFEEEEGGLRRCPDCNENGLIRCPGCCS